MRSIHRIQFAKEWLERVEPDREQESSRHQHDRRGPDDELAEYWENMTRVRMEYLVDPGPAATAVRVAGLVYPGLLIEADAVALLP